MSQNRQLSAIMFTDIEGYTSLMHNDELNGVVLRNKHRKIFKTATEKFKGKVVQYFGDGTLSVFTSSVDAVHCSIEMQLAFIAEQIPVRIGIHSGDILFSEEDIIGDAVNIASRIESCAVTGSVLVSEKVHDQIRSHTEISSQFLDSYELKNVEDAMPIFAISNEGLVIPDPREIKGELKAEPESESKKKSFAKLFSIILFMISLPLAAFFIYQHLSKRKLSDSELSIAVLPFHNLSTDEDSDIFTDGMTEDILTQLSKLKDLQVISRTSVLQYRQSEKTVPEIASELVVAYILEGSIRKYGDEVRVVAQLIDAATDEHIWAENYDRTLTDIFAIQSEVSQEIVDALHIQMSFDEQQSLATIPTNNIEAYQLFLRGRREADKRNKESIEESIELYEKAIRLDPNYAEVYAEIANSIFLQTYYAQSDPIQAAQEANGYLEKAEALNNKISRIYTVKGLVYTHTRQFDKAKEAFERAIHLAPNDVTARHQYATFYYYTDKYERQLEQAKVAYKLDPLSFATAISYFTALTYNQKYDEAENLLKNIKDIDDGSNEFLVNRSYMRLYMAKRDFKKAIAPLNELIKEESDYRRFLGFSYGKIGDTIGAYQIVDSLKRFDDTRVKNHRIAVVFASLQEKDSVFYYLDTVRNKSQLFDSPRIYYFDDIKTDPRYEVLLEQHGLR